jgi:hypothetical protein
VASWFTERIVDTGRLPLFCFFAGVVIGFLLVRVSVRMIRAQVRWWPGNVSKGGVHLHHMVFGVGLMVISGVASLALPDELTGWRAVAGAGFGVGTALVLDEFALMLHLQDVYWSEQGRVSVDAVFAVIALTGILLVGVHPFVVEDMRLVVNDDPVSGLWTLVPVLVLLALAVVTVLKGKLWTGLVGMFVPVLLPVGAIRLARPRSPWARWRYRPGRRRGPRKQERAQRREARWRTPVVRALSRLQDLIAGAPDRRG